MRFMPLAFHVAVLALAAGGLAGCLAVSVAGAAAGVAGTAVGVTAKAASTTVHVGHVAVDAVTPSGGGKEAQDGGGKEAQDGGGR